MMIRWGKKLQTEEPMEGQKDKTAEAGEYVNGIYKTKEELERSAAIKRGQDEAAAEKLRPGEPVKPFIPNPYIAQREKAELADMLLHGYVGSSTKFFIDPRHAAIYGVMYEEHDQYRRHHKIGGLVKAIEDRGMVERAGGMDFVTDIFQGLPE
jgi:hypothetical protein